MDTEYYGSDRTKGQNELASLFIAPSHREREAQLVSTRWFDYSRLHPAQATYYFAHCYRKQTVSFYETYVDTRTAEASSAFTPDDIFISRDMTAMWLARGAADSIGASYPFVMWFAQERAINRLYKSFPRPNQMYGEEFEIDLAAAWRESLARSITFSREDRYRASNYKALLIQVRHVEFVIAQIKARGAPHVNLLGRMISQDVLNPGMLEGHFTEEVIEAALHIARRMDQSSLTA